VRGGNWFNMRFGRQVLTWGTGDFLFLNDLFPKDFNSFFIGRADEYLKAPSNSVQTTFMMKKVGLDLIWTPIFEPGRLLAFVRARPLLWAAVMVLYPVLSVRGNAMDPGHPGWRIRLATARPRCWSGRPAI